ncbi:MAG TPA: carboxylate-amine ligase [Stellaceae bacterium]|nr:carboxylate-amine ligase [Stellaceae bacterium]
MLEPSFTLGIEEEYLLVDRRTRDVVRDPPPQLLAACEAAGKGRIFPEFLRSQIEVATGICASAAAARAELVELRRTVIDIAGAHGMAPIAAATHPFAMPDDQRHTDQDRYRALHDDLQGVARRLMICGMHVHVGIADDELRIDLMNQVSYFLPHLLALSTSSPFWQGTDSGLKSYRIAVFDELPRTGIPERFESAGEYRRHVDMLIAVGVITDASKLWWDIRPSARFPTLEMRVTDVATELDDGIAIACLYRCLLRMLWRLRRANQRWRIYARMLIDENRWRAQRYGIDAGLVDFGRAVIVPYAELLEEIFTLVAEDAAFFDCVAEVNHARTILARGTSAHRQLEVFRTALAGGASQAEALAAVVDWLIEATVPSAGKSAS